MKGSIAIILCFSWSMFFAVEWSMNNTIKFNSDKLSNFDGLQDYNNIVISNGYISPSAESNSYLLTSGIPIDDNYVFSSAFVNIVDNGGSNSYVTMKVFDNADSENIRKQVFYKSGSFELNNIFLRNVTLCLEFTGSDVQVYSFGLTKKGLSLINTNEFIIDPSILFSGENTLNISFSINYPAYTDILIFNKYGKIVDSVCKKRFFNEGTNSVIWDPGTSSVQDLISGGYFIYFKAVSLNNKTAEAVKKLIFVKD